MKVKDIYNWIDAFAPFSSQAAWDNSGLLFGSLEREVSKVLLCLDVTMEAARFAAENGCELMISHHPVLFHPVKQISSDSVYWTLIKNDISVLCAHTNLDKAPGGVNDTLCDALGLEYVKFGEEIAEGFLNTGTIVQALSVPALAKYIAERLGGAVRYIDGGEPISRIAVCSGAGGDLATAAKASGCNTLITGDADHHDFLDAAAIGVSLFAAGHHETEVLITKKLYAQLSEAFPSVAFLEFTNRNPIKTVI